MRSKIIIFSLFLTMIFSSCSKVTKEDAKSILIDRTFYYSELSRDEVYFVDLFSSNFFIETEVRNGAKVDEVKISISYNDHNITIKDGKELLKCNVTDKKDFIKLSCLHLEGTYTKVLWKNLDDALENKEL